MGDKPQMPFCHRLSKIGQRVNTITGEMSLGGDMIPCLGVKCAAFVAQINEKGEPMTIEGKIVGACADVVQAASLAGIMNLMMEHLQNEEEDGEVTPMKGAN